MKKLIFFICCLYSISFFSQTTVSDSIISGGIYRSYRVYIPAIYNASTAVPLVLNLHGYTSNNVQQEFYADFRPIADTANFIIVHPNGTYDGSNNRYWNCFGASTIDDAAFLSELMDTISAQYTIDQNQIYSTGMSNGGFMSYDLACKMSNKIAAIASVTGSMTFTIKNNCNAFHPTPAMQIHGTADGTVPFAGNTYMLPIDSVVKFWVNYNNCNTSPVFTNVPNINLTDGCTAEHYVYSGGTNNSSVEFYKIISGAHTWPGAPITIGVTNQDFSASKEIWRFFRKYKLNLLSSVEKNEEKIDFVVFPNPATNTITLNFKTQELRNISIRNCLGQKIKDTMCTTANINFDFIELPRGIYFVTVSENGKTSTQKIIVQ